MSYPERRKGAPTGRWIAERVVGGKRLRARRDTKAAADHWEKFVDATGAPPPDEQGKAFVLHPFGAIAKEARANRAEWKSTNDTSLDQRLEVVVEFFGHDTDINSITTTKVDEFIVTLASRKGRDGLLSGKTINRYLSVLSAVFEYARKRKGYSKTIHIEWQEESEGRIQYLRDGQDEVLLSHIADTRIRLCVQVLIASGLRHEHEFFSLTPDQIDIRDGLGWITVEGKNGHIDTVAIDAAMARPLKDLIASKNLPTPNECYLAVKAAAKAMGLSDDFTLYSLRHTTGTRAARGNSGPMVQKFLRHRDFRTTQKYIHLADEDVATVALSLKQPLRAVRSA